MESLEFNQLHSKQAWETPASSENGKPFESENAEKTKSYEIDPDRAHNTLEKKLSLQFRTVDASSSQFHAYQESQKNQQDFSCLIGHVSRYWPEDSWLFLFVQDDEKGWIKWVRHEAKFTQEMAQLKRLEKKRIDYWMDISKNFQLMLKTIQERTLEKHNVSQ